LQRRLHSGSGCPRPLTGLRGSAVTSKKRSALAPAKTPADIINKLNGQLLQIVKQPDVKQRFADLGLEPAGNSPQ